MSRITLSRAARLLVAVLIVVSFANAVGVAMAAPSTPALPGATLAGGLAAVPAGDASGDRATVSARAVQQRLAVLHYLPPDAVTGTWDDRTAQAVMAFQGWQGLDRDGSVGRLTLAALASARVPVAAHATIGHSIEVYRSKGVTLLISGGQVVRAVHSSSGRPGYTTPSGSYRVFRKELRSWSYPYRVWLPFASYFNGGIALHAYADVPAVPASHGCIRLSAAEAPYVYAFATVGTLVTVY